MESVRSEVRFKIANLTWKQSWSVSDRVIYFRLRESLRIAVRNQVIPIGDHIAEEILGHE